MNDQNPLEFPQHEAPVVNPNGIPVAHPKQLGPLNKIIKQMVKPRTKLKMSKPKIRTWKKKLSYY